MTSEVTGHYRAVLDDLGAQRRRLAEELAEIDGAIAAIQKRLGTRQAHVPAPVRQEPIRSAGPGVDYTRMSMRWAVLGYMSEEATGPMGTGAIASALEAKGMKSTGPSRFGNLVSAVISNLRAKGEIESVEDGLYQLTAQGRTMWSHIRASQKFRDAQQSAPTLLDGR